MGFGTCGDRFGDNETDVPPPGAYEMDSEVIKGGRKGKIGGILLIPLAFLKVEIDILV